MPSGQVFSNADLSMVECTPTTFPFTYGDGEADADGWLRRCNPEKAAGLHLTVPRCSDPRKYRFMLEVRASSTAVRNVAAFIHFGPSFAKALPMRLLPNPQPTPGYTFWTYDAVNSGQGQFQYRFSVAYKKGWYARRVSSANRTQAVAGFGHFIWYLPGLTAQTTSDKECIYFEYDHPGGTHTTPVVVGNLIGGEKVFDASFTSIPAENVPAATPGQFEVWQINEDWTIGPMLAQPVRLRHGQLQAFCVRWNDWIGPFPKNPGTIGALRLALADPDGQNLIEYIVRILAGPRQGA